MVISVFWLLHVHLTPPYEIEGTKQRDAKLLVTLPWPRFAFSKNENFVNLIWPGFLRVIETWKVIKFKNFIFQALKCIEFGHGKSWEIIILVVRALSARLTFPLVPIPCKIDTAMDILAGLHHTKRLPSRTHSWQLHVFGVTSKVKWTLGIYVLNYSMPQSFTFSQLPSQFSSSFFWKTENSEDLLKHFSNATILNHPGGKCTC